MNRSNFERNSEIQRQLKKTTKKERAIVKKEIPTFKGTIEVAGKSIQTNDVIEITHKKGDAARYRVANIILDDDQPARAVLEPIYGGKSTEMNLDTLAKQESFYVLSKKQREAIAEKEIQDNAVKRQYSQATDAEIDNAFADLQQPSEAQRLAMAEAEIAAMRAGTKTERMPTPIAQVQKELNNFVSLREQLRAQEESHIKQVQDKIAEILSEHESSVASKGFREMTPTDKRNVFSEPIPALLSRPETTEYPPVNQMSQNNTQTQPAPSFLRNITSGIRNLFQKKPELPTGANLPRTIYTEHATSLTQSRFTPPPGFETPTSQSIRDIISGTKKTRYETDPETVAQDKRDANRAAEQITKKTQPTALDTGYADRYAAYQKSNNATPTQTPPSFLGNITSNIRSLFSRKTELQTGASLRPALNREIPKLSDDTILPSKVDTKPAADNIVHLADFRKSKKFMSDEEEDEIIAEMEKQMRETQAKQERERRRHEDSGSAEIEAAE